MDFDLRDSLLIIGPLFIAAILLHGYWRMRRNSNQIKMSLDRNFMSEPGERLFQIPGSMPSLKNVPSGCPFHPRCKFATEQCKQAMPEYVRSGNVNVACYEVANLIEQEKRMQEAES